MSQTIFVTGATGQQGSAVIDTLVSSSSSTKITIHGLTRDLSSASAKALLAKHPNIKLFPGSFDNVPSITNAATNCTSAFFNVTPVFNNTGSIDSTAEARHARNLVEACSNILRIRRIVFSSTSAMHSPKLTEIFNEYIPKHPTFWAAGYMTSKKASEEAITISNFPDGWAILRGFTFFTNFLKPSSSFMYPDLESKQTITTAYSEDHQVSFVDPNDVGALAARMLMSTPEEWTDMWRGKFVPLLSENLAMTEIVAAMKEALVKRGVEKQIKLIHLSEQDVKERAKNGDMVMGIHVFASHYLPACDVDEVRTFGIDVDGLTKAKEFFDKESRRLVETVGGA